MQTDMAGCIDGGPSIEPEDFIIDVSSISVYQKVQKPFVLLVT